MIDLTLDHIGVAVKNLDDAINKYQELLNARVVHREEVPSQGVAVCFLEYKTQRIELLKPLNAESPVARFIQKRGEGIHHIAYKTENIETEMVRIRNMGMQVLQEKPVPGAWNKMIFFIHPRSVGGVLVEICQSAGND